LAIEITSPATAERDRHYNKTLYAGHGMREYWIVDPEVKTVEVFALTEEGFQPAKAYKKGETLRPLF